MKDHHLLNWYDEAALDIATNVLGEFEVELNAAERKAIRDTIYTAVNDAKVRAARARESQR